MHHLYFAFKVLPCKKNTHLQGNTIFYMKARLKIETRLLYPDQFLRRSCILKRPLLSAVNCVLQHFSTCRIQVHAYLKDVLHALHNCCFFQSKQWVGGCAEQSIVIFFRYNGLQAVLNCRFQVYIGLKDEYILDKCFQHILHDYKKCCFFQLIRSHNEKLNL